MIIGLDVGGTHTDVVLLKKSGPVKNLKVPTDTSDLFNTVLQGFDKITEGIDPKEIKRAVISTTLTTNAIVQSTVQNVGMIVIGGPGIDPELFKTNEHYYSVKGYIDHRGREAEKINESEIIEIAKKFKKEGILHVGVVGKFSARNPSQENKVFELLESDFEKIFLGHKVSGNLNFPRRIATTYLNAAVYPIHKEFFEAVKNSLAAKGLDVPIHILKADGGTMSFKSSIDFPAQTIFSGPAASVMGAIATAPDKDVIVLDIGGTTTDIAMLIDGAPVLEPLGIALGGYKTLIRSLKTRSIGIGGDSHVRVEDGKIKIGPERLGPAMAYGGPVPTTSDAVFVLKDKSSKELEKSTEAVKIIADDLNIPVKDAAQKIFDNACQIVLQEVEKTVLQINSQPVYTIHELLEGYKVKPTTIMVLGGPAKEFAIHLEKISDYSVGIVHEWRVANAIGAGLARPTCEVMLFADTQHGIIAAPEEDFQEPARSHYNKNDAIAQATELLKEKANKNGSSEEDFEVEIIEDLEFNMVRGFSTVGKNIRVKVQVKPGLIHGYDPIGS